MRNVIYEYTFIVTPDRGLSTFEKPKLINFRLRQLPFTSKLLNFTDDKPPVNYLLCNYSTSSLLHSFFFLIFAHKIDTFFNQSIFYVQLKYEIIYCRLDLISSCRIKSVNITLKSFNLGNSHGKPEFLNWGRMCSFRFWERILSNITSFLCYKGKTTKLP